MRIGSTIWKLKQQMRRNPMGQLIPILVTIGMLLYSLLKLVKWVLISSSVLWLLSGLAAGLGIGWLLWRMGGRGGR